MDSRKFVHAIVRNALFNVRKSLEDGGDWEKSIGIMYSKKTWKRIILNFEEFRDYALTKNLDVFLSRDGTRCIFFKLIKKEIWQ